MYNKPSVLIAGFFALSVFGSSIAAETPASAPDVAADAVLDAKLVEQIKTRGYVVGKLVDSVPNYQIDSWNSLDRRHLIFNSGPGRSYLLSLRIDCPELSGADDIGFTTTATRLTALDSVKVETAGGGVPRTCPIVSIKELSRIPKKK